ncbi:MAG TPA: N,N-dimethylformamidase beta subunit family domain-containing protein [Kineosporiaceae bacterium]|nr:N,N-dimethylformamidase beta subunit family domain-containing protein [Kineosporiaceae bacterium]
MSEPAPSTSASAASSTPTDGQPAAGVDVAAENRRAGSTDAVIGRTRGSAPGLQAYADRVSVLPGQQIGVYVDARGPVTIEALRTGWYGGAGARVLWRGLAVARPQPKAAVENGPVPDAGGLRDGRTAVAPWHLTILLDTTGWPEGAYLLRVDTATASRLVPVTLRSASARGRLLLVQSAMTWQAYNSWGGGSLYDGGEGSFGDRSLAVSFDRPYVDAYGAGRFAYYDLPILRVAERLGLPLAYATDYDLGLDPGLLDGATGVVIGGHAEYWTPTAREAVVDAVAHGANLAVFGANTAYWRARLAGRSTGLLGQPDRRDGRPRLVVVTKDAHLDPLAAADPGGATARFRDHPDPRPEQQLTGMQYDCFPARASWVVTEPSWFGYAGLGARAGQDLGAFVLPEADRVYPGPYTPATLEVVAYDRYACRPGTLTAHTGVYWTDAAGAGVFATGTMGWACALAGSCATTTDRRATSAAVDRITANVLTAFARPHAGAAHPARPNVARFWLPTTVTSGAA